MQAAIARQAASYRISFTVIGCSFYSDDAPLDWLPADGGALHEFLPIVDEDSVFDENIEDTLDT